MFVFLFNKSFFSDLKQMLKAIGEALVLLEKTPEVKATYPNLSNACKSSPLLEQTNGFKAINPDFPSAWKLSFNMLSPSSSQNTSVDQVSKSLSFNQNNFSSDNNLPQSFSPSFQTSNLEMHPESSVDKGMFLIFYLLK